VAEVRSEMDREGSEVSLRGSWVFIVDILSLI
jgi:hypothetical protein